MAAKKSKEQLTVKASITIGVREHALWAYCAKLKRMDNSAFAVEAIKAACSGLIVVDKRKPASQVKLSDRPESDGGLSPDGPSDAA